MRDRWNNFSDNYTEMINKKLSIQCAKEMHRHMELDSASSVLEVGAGAGIGSVDILGYLNARSKAAVKKFHATDLSPAMLALAKERIKPETYPFPVVLAEANALQLDAVADASVDRYMSTLVLQLVPDADAMLRESYRVLCVGGLAGFVIWGREANSGLFGLLVDALKEQGKPVPGFSSNFNLGRDVPALGQRIRAAGFAAYSVWPYVATIETWSARAYVAFMAALYPDMLEQDKELEARLGQLATEWLAAGKPIGLETYIVLAKKQ
ncbi:Aste57867_14683 [Aphanomyces stellatus]|uniref:Aste57867_14683 protein n=1 Tax=Aphanomyces stellatus TaxID=120398 RepID=A0A485L1B6_9STRA|nr:hypothetical protein As57867_014628 [Aphanomyces stellatus]VFT91501.1 Aste57867_14683 [Aphanomyces stellatus]